MAGTMVLLSVVLVLLVSSWWLLLTTFVGLNLLQSGITGLCPAEAVLRRLPFVAQDEGATCSTGWRRMVRSRSGAERRGSLR